MAIKKGFRKVKGRNEWVIFTSSEKNFDAIEKRAKKRGLKIKDVDDLSNTGDKGFILTFVKK